MKVLVIGSGGREHALVWKIAQSPLLDALHAAPGSKAISSLATCHPESKADDLDGLVAFATGESIDLVVVGPEDPLAAGISDRLRGEGVAVFGPSQRRRNSREVKRSLKTLWRAMIFRPQVMLCSMRG